MEKLDILKQEVEKINNKISENYEEHRRLEIIRDVLQREIEMLEPSKNDDLLPF